MSFTRQVVPAEIVHFTEDTRYVSYSNEPNDEPSVILLLKHVNID